MNILKNIKKKNIEKIKRRFKKYNIVLNINKDMTKVQRKALIIYVDMSFKKHLDKDIYHTQILEMNQIVKNLIDRDYSIDVVNVHENIALDIVKDIRYDLILGLGDLFEKMCILNPDAKKIIYVTENHPKFSYEKEMERVNYYYSRHKKKVGIVRSNQYYKESNFDYVDGAIIMGEDIYFDKYDFPFKTIEPTGLINFNYRYIDKNYSESKKNFLWFGGNGIIHKGLDLLIDIFSNRNDVTLHVCGLSDRERKKFKIKACDNIRLYGKIDVNSKEYLDIVNICSFVILPSCSEAHSTGVLTCMRHALIPIVMKGSGFSRLQEHAIFLEDYKVEYIDSVISNIIGYSNDNIKRMDKEVYNFSKLNFTIDSYDKKLKECFDFFAI